jgi:hypothetical protein
MRRVRLNGPSFGIEERTCRSTFGQRHFRFSFVLKKFDQSRTGQSQQTQKVDCPHIQMIFRLKRRRRRMRVNQKPTIPFFFCFFDSELEENTEISLLETPQKNEKR